MGFGKKTRFMDDREEITEAVRKATNKHLTRPDTALNAKVVSVINSGGSDVDGKGVASIIVNRMRDDNPHKQWLSVALTQRVLRDCKDRLADGKQELLQDVAVVATRAVMSHVVNASAAQKAKQEAFMLLQEHGDDGVTAIRAAGGQAAVQLLVNEQADSNRAYQQPDSYRSPYQQQRATALASSWPETKAMIDKEIQVATSQMEVLQDMLRNLKAGTGGCDRSFLEELTAQMVSFRLTFEANMARLGAYDTQESSALTARAIETVEKMNKALEEYHETRTRRPPPASAPAPPKPADSLIDLGTPAPASSAVPSPPAASARSLPAQLNGLLISEPAPAPSLMPAPAPMARAASGNPFGDDAPLSAAPAAAVPPSLSLSQAAYVAPTALADEFGMAPAFGSPTPPQQPALVFSGFQPSPAPSHRGFHDSFSGTPSPTPPFPGSFPGTPSPGGLSPSGSVNSLSPALSHAASFGSTHAASFGSAHAPSFGSSPAASFSSTASPLPPVLPYAGSACGGALPLTPPAEAAAAAASANPFASPRAGAVGQPTYGSGRSSDLGMLSLGGSPYSRHNSNGNANSRPQSLLSELDPLPSPPRAPQKEDQVPMRLPSTAGATVTLSSWSPAKAVTPPASNDAFDELVSRR